MERIPKQQIKHRVGEVLEMVQLSGMGARKPKQLSGGQQQRVALARALVKHPAVLLLDEPLGALDLKLRKEMQLELKALQQDVGITFVYVTHDQEEALTMSDRIAVMNKGVALQIGTPVEIYERPSNRFVADFIGESNFLSGIVSELEGATAKVILDGIGIPLIGLKVGDIVPGQKVIVSVRPEKIRLSDHPALKYNCYKTRVTHSTYIGSDTRVMISLGENIHMKVWEQNNISTLDPSAYYKTGQELWASVFSENALVLEDV